VSSEGFSGTQGFPFSNLPFNTSFGLFFAAISHFGFHGLQIHIISESPVKSALGGSSTALIALIKSLSKLTVLLGGKGLSPKEILYLGYHLEDGISGGYCGIQDQASAVFGGVNQWRWTYGNQAFPFRRESLLDGKGQRELSDRLLLAYSGRSHVSARINRSWINDFLSGKTRSGWIQANHIVLKLAQAIKGKDWDLAASLLREEMSIRKEITPNALIPVTENLIDQAEGVGCGARFAGAGAGGTVWALGEMNKIRKLRELWNKTLAPHKGASILNCAVDPMGVR
ncbi:MAG: galactokinase, partial [Pseudomonadota bacterium]